MTRILLDTNFILTCIRNKIDFFDEFYFSGYKLIIPEQIINEIEKIKNSDKKAKFRQEAELALLILKKHHFEKITLEGKNVDNAIVNYAHKNPEIIVATLDREIKSKIKNRKMIFRGKKFELI